MERALPLSDDTQAAQGKTSRQMPFSRRLWARSKINRKPGRLPRGGMRVLRHPHPKTWGLFGVYFRSKWFEL